MPSGQTTAYADAAMRRDAPIRRVADCDAGRAGGAFAPRHVATSPVSPTRRVAHSPHRRFAVAVRSRRMSTILYTAVFSLTFVSYFICTAHTGLLFIFRAAGQ